MAAAAALAAAAGVEGEMSVDQEVGFMLIADALRCIRDLVETK